MKDDCISRNDLLRTITAYQGVVDKSVAKRLVIQASAIDIADAVRCENCRYYKLHDNKYPMERTDV